MILKTAFCIAVVIVLMPAMADSGLGAPALKGAVESGPIAAFHDVVMDSIVRVRADIAAHERARGEPVPRI